MADAATVSSALSQRDSRSRAKISTAYARSSNPVNKSGINLVVNQGSAVATDKLNVRGTSSQRGERLPNKQRRTKCSIPAAHNDCTMTTGQVVSFICKV